MRIGVPFLHEFWSSRHGQPNATTDGPEWVRINTLLAGLRLGLRETFEFLLRHNPSFDEFEDWILALNDGSVSPTTVERLNAALSGHLNEPAVGDPVLSAADLAFWEENGYLVVHNSITPEQCQAAVAAICDFVGATLDNPDTWYNDQHGHTIWTPLLHHPALQANRDAPRIHRAFAQLWGREDLWGNVDQAGFNPPERPGWTFPGPYLHWDVSLAQPIPFGLQGILYLADTAANQGAFQCVPGFHRKIEDWLNALPEGADPRAYDFTAEAVPIAGKAGDLVIWHHALPHGASPNRATMPRIVQYLIHRPSEWGYNSVWR